MIEYYCANDLIESESVSCQTGCNAGACLKQAGSSTANNSASNLNNATNSSSNGNASSVNSSYEYPYEEEPVIPTFEEEYEDFEENDENDLVKSNYTVAKENKNAKEEKICQPLIKIPKKGVKKNMGLRRFELRSGGPEPPILPG